MVQRLVQRLLEDARTRTRVVMVTGALVVGAVGGGWLVTRAQVQSSEIDGGVARVDAAEGSEVVKADANADANASANANAEASANANANAEAGAKRQVGEGGARDASAGGAADSGASSSAASKEAASKEGRDVTLDERAEGKTIDLAKGQSLVVMLPASPSSGFDWAVLKAPAALGAPQMGFVAGGDAIGAAGRRRLAWTLHDALTSGEHSVELGYRRSFEQGVAPFKTFRFKVRPAR